MKFLFFIFPVFFTCSIIFGQALPNVRQVGKTTTATDLLGTIKTLKCSRKISLINGTVINRNFEDDETTIGGFIVRSANGKETALNLDIERIKSLGESSATIINSLIANGRKTKVWYAPCTNGSRNYNFATKIVSF